MRRLSRLALAIACAVTFSQPSLAVEPDDQPWDEIDRVLKDVPEPFTAQSQPQSQNTTAAGETPGGVDRDPEPGIENDRLRTEHADDPNAGPWGAPSKDASPQDAPAQARVPAQPSAEAPSQAQSQPLAPAPNQAATQHPPAQMGPPAPDQSIAAEPAAAPKPTERATSVSPAPAIAPAQQTAAPSPPTPTAAPPPQATAPSATQTTEAAAATDQLYLPMRRYLDTKAVVTLKAYDQADRAALSQFYDARMGQALWLTRTGLTPAADSLIAELKKADDWGLSSKDFSIPNTGAITNGTANEDDLVDVEIKLSLAAMQYARYARGGRIANPTEQLSSYIDRKPQLLEPAKVIEALATAPDKAAYLRGLNPKHPQFEKLRQKLLELRSGTPKQEIVKIPTSGPKLSPGKTHEQIGLIRRRLNVPAPELQTDGTPATENFYDPVLARAIIQFKEANKVEPYTATITNDVRRRLNVDEGVSEDALLANMEQWRWMPEDLGNPRIAVTVPEFMVHVMKDETPIHSERIVTGRYETQTPIFSDRMRTVVFNPSWIVPHSIMINELLPKLRAGGNPIARQGLEIKRNDRLINAYEVDWNRSDIRNYHIYQPPGPSNVLGVVKFLFPNKHAVYLHDTPSKSLFNASVRTFSHGCVRVRNPVQLAEVILAADKGWDKSTVDDLVANGPGDNDIALDKPMPVHITYFTAWVEDDGSVKTFADIYGHQKRITLALAGRWSEIVKNRDHMLPPEISKVPVARNREDWADPDGWSDRGPRDPRLTYRAVPPPPGYKKNTSVGDMLQQVFGGF